MANNKVPTCFGFPMWKGKIKKRVAKKRINRRWKPKYGKSHFSRMKEFANYGIGDLINDCTAFNVKITELDPDYWQFGSGEVLMNVDIRSALNSASFWHCGIEHPKSYKDLKAQIEKDIEAWEKAGDEYGFAKRYREGTLNPDGTFTRAENKTQ